MSIKGFGSFVRPINSSEKEEMDSQIELKDEEVDRSSLTNVLGSANSEDQAPAVGEDEPVASNDEQGLLSLAVARPLSSPPSRHDVYEIIAFSLSGENRFKPSGYRPENYLPEEDEENRREWEKQQRESFLKVADRHPETMPLFQESEKLRSSTVKAKDDPHTFLKLRQNAILCKVLGGSDWVEAFTRSFSGNELSEGPWESFDGLQDNMAFQEALQNIIGPLKDHIAAEEEKEARAKLSWTKDPSGRIRDEHYQELLDSVIHPAMIALNFQTIGGNTHIQKLLNNSTVNFTYGLLMQGRPLFSKNAPELKGVSGMAKVILTTAAINFKPGDNHKLDKKGKPTKYTQPRKARHGASFLKDACLRSSMTAQGEIIEDENYWQRVLADPKYRIAFPEGEKKAAAMMSVSRGKIAAIALSGVTLWNQKDTRDLRTELAPFSTPGRPLIICFDSDKWKVKEGQQQIRTAELRLATAFYKQSANVRMIDLSATEAAARREAAPNFPGDYKLNEETGEKELRKWGIDDHLVCFDKGDRMAELQQLMDNSEEYNPTLTLKVSETLELGVERLWNNNEVVTGRCSRYVDGGWYESTIPRIFEPIAGAEIEARVRVMLSTIKVLVPLDTDDKHLKKAVDAALKDGVKAEKGWIPISAGKGTTRNLRDCLPWLQNALSETFIYDPEHLTFADGQVMELSTGKMIDGSHLPPTVHSLPFNYQPTEFDDLTRRRCKTSLMTDSHRKTYS